MKNPCDEDNDEILARSRLADAPRKRIDKFKTNGGSQYSQLTVGSPVVGRRGFVINHGPRHQSCHTTPLQSPCTSPIVTSKDMFMRDTSSTTTSQNIDLDNISITSNNSTNINQQIRSRINSFKITDLARVPQFLKRRKNSLNSKYYLFHQLNFHVFILLASETNQHTNKQK